VIVVAEIKIEVKLKTEELQANSKFGNWGDIDTDPFPKGCYKSRKW
jgi:hypothetical protein